MWLRDKLPRDVPRCRHIIYGYNTSLKNSGSFQTIEDLAISFIERLRAIRGSSAATLPLIFFAHSLGGIVLKHIFHTIHINPAHRDLIPEEHCSILFFATPHYGMEVTNLLETLPEQPQASLIRSISTNSLYLKVIDQSFRAIAERRHTQHICLYETKRSPTIQVGKMVMTFLRC